MKLVLANLYKRMDFTSKFEPRPLSVFIWKVVCLNNSMCSTDGSRVYLHSTDVYEYGVFRVWTHTCCCFLGKHVLFWFWAIYWLLLFV